MGKHRRRNKFYRTNPTGLPSLKDLESEGADFSTHQGSHQGALIGALEKLKSAVQGERECGAETLALVAQNKALIEELLRRDVVRIAAPLLLDRSPTVRHSVSGSLRNLTAIGGPDVCEHFVQKDVLTPVVHLYKKFYQKWKPAQPKEGVIDSSTEVFIEVTNLLWNLCESSEQAVSVFNAQNLLEIFLPCLDVSEFGLRVTLVSAQCLQAVTENNSDLLLHKSLDKLKSSVLDLVSLLGVQPVDHHLRTLAAGIYLNTHGGTLVKCPADEVAKLFDVISRALGLSLKDAVWAFKRKNEDLNKEEHPEDNLVLGVTAEREELAKHTLVTVLAAKQVALEVLTNICCDDDGADEWESLCSSEAGDDMEVAMEEDSPSETNMVALPCEIQEALGKYGLLQQVEEHSFIADEILAELDSADASRDIQEKFETLQCRALLCLHNLVSGGLDSSESDGYLQQLWVRMAKLVLSTAAKSQSDLLEATTSCLRAVVQRLGEGKVLSCIAHLTLDDLNALYGVVHGCQDAKVRVNVLRVVGVVGVLLASTLSTDKERFLASIGKFLLDLGLKDEDVWVNAEAVDAIMDVFAEDHLDRVAQEISLLQKCKHINGNLKAKARQVQKQAGEHLPMVAIVKTNLHRFIKYKSQMTSNGNCEQ